MKRQPTDLPAAPAPPTEPASLLRRLTARYDQALRAAAAARLSALAGEPA